ncbi:MAG: hypothetical protein V2A76_00935 [Planctomycetota bacterium]
MSDEERQGRIESTLQEVSSKLAGLTASVNIHVADERGQLDRIEASVDRLKVLHTRVALLEDREGRQAWWNRTFIVGILGLVSAWVAARLK